MRRKLIFALVPVLIVAFLLATGSAALAAPAKVTGMKAVKIKSNAVTVKWNKAFGADQYQVKVRKMNGKLVSAKKTSDSVVIITGLKKSTDYKVSVRAKDSYGVYGKRSAFEAFKTKSWRNYHNSQYGFSLDFPKDWKGYWVNSVGDYKDGRQFDFFLYSDAWQDDYYIFTVWAVAGDHWPEISAGWLDESILGENDEYVFIYYTAMDTAPDLLTKVQELDDTLNSFDLD